MYVQLKKCCYSVIIARYNVTYMYMYTFTLQAKAQEEEASRQSREKERLLRQERGRRDKPKRQKQLRWRATGEKEEVTQGRSEVWVLPGMEEKQKVCGEEPSSSTVMDSGLGDARTSQLSHGDLGDIEVHCTVLYVHLCILYMYVCTSLFCGQVRFFEFSLILFILQVTT